MLDHVNVMSHGVHTPLSHVAAVSVSSLETLTVMPYDSSVSKPPLPQNYLNSESPPHAISHNCNSFAGQTIKEVEKAIRNSPLKLNPVEEGEVLRVPIPK